MVDLDVYRRAGSVLLAGGNFYDLPGQLQFLYPPFAAVLAVPLALLPTPVVQIGWTAAGAMALVAILHRFGLTGWLLSLAGVVVVYVVEPVVQTLAFGQLGIFLVALVVLDLAPGPRVLPRRLLPEGVLTAVATAIKLTPAIFVVYLLLVRKFRAFWVAVVTGIVVTLASAAIIPAASYEFWTRLAQGDTGLGHSLIYYTNQSVMANIVRIFGVGPEPAAVGLALSAVVAVAGVWAAVLWHRLGDIRLAVNLCGVAGLLASPVSWLHHFVWVVPLAHEPPRAASCQSSQSPNLVPRSRLALYRLGCARTVHRATQRSRRRTPVELVAAPARLDHNPHRPRTASGCDHHRPAAGTDDLRSAEQQRNRSSSIQILIKCETGSSGGVVDHPATSSVRAHVTRVFTFEPHWS